MLALSGFFEWCRLQGDFTTENPVKGVYRMPQAKRAREQRAAWTVDDLNRLFSSPCWAGCKSLARRATPGSTIIRDALFWTPLIAIFSGMRLEEICALLVDDIREEEGVFVFDVRPGDGKLLKTAASVRRVPVHQDLIAIGLLDWVDDERRQRGKGKRLFAELKPGGRDGRYGYSVTRDFGRYRSKVGIVDLDFHGFRHAAITGMQRAFVPEPLLKDIVGHEDTNGETGRYSKGFTIAQLAEHMNKLVYPALDLSHLRP
jgi:integrase